MWAHHCRQSPFSAHLGRSDPSCGRGPCTEWREPSLALLWANQRARTGDSHSADCWSADACNRWRQRLVFSRKFCVIILVYNETQTRKINTLNRWLPFLKFLLSRDKSLSKSLLNWAHQLRGSKCIWLCIQMASILTQLISLARIMRLLLKWNTQTGSHIQTLKVISSAPISPRSVTIWLPLEGGHFQLNHSLFKEMERNKDGEREARQSQVWERRIF